LLVDAGFEAEARDASLAGVGFEMLEQQLAQALAAVRGADVHAFEFGVVGADELEAATAGGQVVLADDEEGDAFAEETFDAEAVAAFDGVELAEVIFELCDELCGGWGVGAFLGDDGGHLGDAA
jgi:hypothetical protein